jgi:Nucleotidyl transferase AbiEii toxin, Type IV TA system
MGPDPFDAATPFESKNKRRAAQEDVFEAARRFVYEPLKQSLSLHLPDVRIEEDRSKENQPTLLIWYPSVYPAPGGDEPEYNQRRVKIEAGPRGATEPTSDKLIRPYIHAALRDKGFNLTVPRVTMIRAERTFLEKVSAIHTMNRKFEAEQKEPRQEQPPSRHLYDVASMMSRDIGKAAVSMRQLLQDVCSDSENTFPSPYIKEIREGQIRLVPPAGLRQLLEGDYEKMKGMVYGANPPTLDELYAQLADAEARINRMMQG